MGTLQGPNGWQTWVWVHPVWVTPLSQRAAPWAIMPHQWGSPLRGMALGPSHMHWAGATILVGSMHTTQRVVAVLRHTTVLG